MQTSPSTPMFQIYDIISDISRLHNVHSNSWIAIEPDVINLKQKHIVDICTPGSDVEQLFSFDDIFIEKLNAYCEFLNTVFDSPYYEFLEWDIESRNRIKEPTSRLDKIVNYRFTKKEQGKVSINKCLNDLLGFRIYVDDFMHGIETNDIIKTELTGLNIKVNDSSKMGYRATHVYFSNGNNKCFPWELQIWNNEDRKSNDMSHSLHKQGYTKWAEEFIKAGFYNQKEGYNV